MLIGSPDTVIAIHVFKNFVGEQNCRSPFLAHSKIWGWQLINLRRLHDLIHATAFLFADAQTPHQIGQSLIARLVFINKPVRRNERLPWI